MSALPELSNPRIAPSPVLIGVLVDVSNSMRRNWRKKGGKKAERQTSLEQASFDGSQVGSRIFAKAQLLPTGFLAML